MPTRLLVATPRARRWLRAAVVACAPALAFACSDSATGPSDVAGTYAIESVDGQPLPVSTTTNEDVETLTDGQLVLRDDRTYRVDVNYTLLDRATGGIETSPATDTGTYTLSGNTITVRSDDTSSGVQSMSGTVSGSRISLGGFVFVRR